MQKEANNRTHVVIVVSITTWL